jgi:hypothetical protein
LKRLSCPVHVPEPLSNWQPFEHETNTKSEGPYEEGVGLVEMEAKPAIVSRTYRLIGGIMYVIPQPSSTFETPSICQVEVPVPLLNWKPFYHEPNPKSKRGAHEKRE